MNSQFETRKCKKCKNTFHPEWWKIDKEEPGTMWYCSMQCYWDD